LEDGDFITNDTLCRQVSNREPQLKRFATAYEVVVFVSGRKSSNGKALYTVCKNINPDSYFVSSADEIEADWFSGKQTVGIAGATSTPMWLMEQVKEKIEQMAVLESH
ncbi:MAG: 4-hydroxy-3-methylbut-2-enyl diphosphate reductase, partial [Bacteroidota bacterium]